MPDNSIKLQLDGEVVHTPVTADRILKSVDLQKVFTVHKDGGSVTITLDPVQEGDAGKLVLLRNIGAGAVTVKSGNKATFAAGSLTLAKNESVLLMVDGVNKWSALLHTGAEAAIHAAIQAGVKNGGEIYKVIEARIGDAVKSGGLIGNAIATALSAQGDHTTDGIAKKVMADPAFRGKVDAALNASGRKLIQVETVSTARGNVNFNLDDNYSDYEIEFSNVTTDNATSRYFVMQISKDKNPTRENQWKKGGYALSQLEDRSTIHKEGPLGGADAELHSHDAAALVFQGDLNKGGGASISGRIRLVAPHNNKLYHHFLMDTISSLSTGEHVRTEGGGVYFRDTEAYHAVRLFYCSAGAPNGPEGHIIGGEFRLYGVLSKV